MKSPKRKSQSRVWKKIITLEKLKHWNPTRDKKKLQNTHEIE